MSIEGDLFDALKAVYDADTGSGGLKNSSATAFVRQFTREDDPDARDANQQTPRVLVSIPSIPEEDTFTRGRAIVFGRFIVVTERDRGFTEMDPVLDRLRSQYHRASLTASSSWSWSPFNIRRTAVAPASGSEMRRVIEWQLVALRTSGVA